MKSYHILIILFVFSLGQQIKAQEQVTLTLDDAINLAKQQNIDISISQKQFEISEFALKESKGNFLPKLSASANYNRNIDRQVIFLPNGFGMSGAATELGSDNDYRASLNLSMPLFSKYNFVNKQFSENRLDFQQEVSRGTEQSIVNTTKKAYFNYLIAQEVVMVQQHRLNNASETLKDIKKRVKQGILTEFDITSARVQVANATTNLLEAKNSIVPAANVLKLVLGLSPDTNVQLTDSISILEKELLMNESIKSMLKNNSRLKQLELDISIAETQIKMAESAYYPNVDFVGNYVYQAQADDFEVSNYDWVHTSLVGLQVNIPIFNGTVTNNKVQQAKISKDIAEKEKAYATDQYRMRYQEIMTNLNFSLQKTEVQKENMELTAEALALAKKRYNLGVGTFLEVNDAELSYTQSRLSWLQAISNYKNAFYDYQLLIGNDLN
ncbi:TolC family protein [Winogradskyella bathintestinalis]|uniref:TolC family protein n=1 Tax=Winogradskyella bathintestinalis TaxID=3035208 RepID=A0ABT7ZW49_9FLAO|nr:TolC family protein [Winogradskyella bathintestinalis]MDN3493247.1 TolC family protein [Winogradskyella bathintestinalis]